MAESTPIRFELRAGAVTAVPLAVAVGLFGVSFGVLSASSGGMGALPAIVMSATTFAGSGSSRRRRSCPPAAGRSRPLRPHCS